MKKNFNETILSAGDIAGHIACHHLTYLNLAVVMGRLDEPEYRDPALAALQRRGQTFESEFLERLREEGKTIMLPDPETDQLSLDRTVSAMQGGVDVIYQASLRSGNWQGIADFLVKVEKPSRLGNWSYEVIDSKLARETRAGTILQICLYSELIGDIQHRMPEEMHVVTPEDGLNMLTYHVNDCMAYYRLIKANVLAIVHENQEYIPTYPIPSAHCNICRWWLQCDRRRREDDHLSLVAGMSNSQAAELQKWNVKTLEALGEIALPLPFKPSKGALETYIRLREQARLQLLARKAGRIEYEYLEIVERKGLASLPKPSKGDIFFDFEGDPFVGNSGLEYLFGWVEADNPGSHRTVWAFNAEEEKASLELFVDMVIARWKAFPDLHIYHFTPYEPSSLKRLMGRYATRENEIDTMLRAGIFIDLHSVFRQAIRAGVETYSLKELEKLHAFERQFELRAAAGELRTMELHLETNDLAGIPDSCKHAVAAYNFDDCNSTLALRDFLEDVRQRQITSGVLIERPHSTDGAPGDTVTRHQERIKPLFDQLTAGVPADRLARTPEQHGRWLLANMLDWYRREEKANWWEYFRLLSLSPDDLLEEKEAIAGLRFTGHRVADKKSVIDQYAFPLQECELNASDRLKDEEGNDFGEVNSVDKSNGFIEIRKGPSIKEKHATSVFALSIVPDKEKEDSIIRLATYVSANSIDGLGDYQCSRDLLLNLPPRIKSAFQSAEAPQQKAVAWVKELDCGVLPIQGPPGTGKSHTAAQMIVDLVRNGKRIGITALSHKVVAGLMEKVVETARNIGFPISCLRRVSIKSEHPSPGILEETDYKKCEAAIKGGGTNILGGSAWLWAREQFRNSVDVLFVDEAGQLALIDTLAVSQAALNIVLLGDPQQLKQPQQGSHPEGTEVSALEHILGDHQTIPEDRGILLDLTWRMHPSICGFVSELFYESRLLPLPELENQQLTGDTKFPRAGLWYVPVRHEGNQSSSVEEAELVGNIISDLLAGKVNYTDKAGISRQLSHKDIKVIAPFNAQVNLLKKSLPTEVQIGTVDKFQGQEAPVVIFSMATSRPEDAPRGIEFLYSSNRLNVAVSRARSTFILVASPLLLEPDCRNVKQMRLANAFCRFIELKR